MPKVTHRRCTHDASAISVGETLLRGLSNAVQRRGNTAARLLGIGFFVRAMRSFTSGLLSGLGNMRGAFRKVLSLFLLFVDDFLVVSNVSWVGHRTL